MQSLEHICMLNFLDHVHPCLAEEAATLSAISDMLLRATRMVRVLQLSSLAKIIHPSLLRNLKQGLALLKNEDFKQWESDLMFMNSERTKPPNTIGRIHQASDENIAAVQRTFFLPDSLHRLADSPYLTATEHHAKQTGKLEGITSFTQDFSDFLQHSTWTQNIWHIRMDSFVHPEVYFEVDYDTEHNHFLSSFDEKTGSFHLNGRLSTFAASELRIRMIGNNRFRVDDLLHPQVWAECDLPQKAKKLTRVNNKRMRS
jgi:hypothetical protein